MEIKETLQNEKTLFQETSDTFPGAVFFMSAGFSLMTLILSIVVHLSLRGRRFSDVVKADGGNDEEGKENVEDNKVLGFYGDLPPSYDTVMISHI